MKTVDSEKHRPQSRFYLISRDISPSFVLAFNGIFLTFRELLFSNVSSEDKGYYAKHGTSSS